MNLRELVLDMLMELEKGKVYSNILIRNVLDKYDYLPAKDKAFIKRVTEGVLERRIQIDYVINGKNEAAHPQSAENECVPAAFYGWGSGFGSVQ